MGMYENREIEIPAMTPGQTAGNLDNMEYQNEADIHEETAKDTINDVDAEGRDEVHEWLCSTVEMEQYYEYFVNNGFDSLKLIKKIKDYSELQHLGIETKAHQILIMQNIKKLSLGNNINEHTLTPSRAMCNRLNIIY